MVELADFLFKTSPLILGILALFIVPASQRAANKKKDVEVVTGKPVEFGETDYLKNDLEQEREINRLRILCERAGIDWEAGAPKKREKQDD